MPVLGEAAQHVSDALLQCVQLGLDQDLGHQVLAGKLDESLA